MHSLEIERLLELSARIGREPLLVQAASGNTSLKRDGVLWVKASGKWLAHALHEDILIPVDHAESLRRIEKGIDPAGQTVEFAGKRLGTSVETAMHAVMPHRVVVHVHSVNTISLAVRRDGAGEVASRLRGMDWDWVPYAPSGLALARGVEAALARNRAANVLVLANHGLVVGAESCEAAEQLLTEVECRLGMVTRTAAEADIVRLQELSSAAPEWRVARNPLLHQMATDEHSRQVICEGTLYPCQAIFLTAAAQRLPCAADANELRSLAGEPFVLIDGAGMLVKDHMNAAEAATLDGLAQVLRRIPASASVRYLDEREVGDLLCADVYGYRKRVEGNSTMPAVLAARVAPAGEPVSV